MYYSASNNMCVFVYYCIINRYSRNYFKFIQYIYNIRKSKYFTSNPGCHYTLKILVIAHIFNQLLWTYSIRVFQLLSFNFHLIVNVSSCFLLGMTSP